MLLFRRGYGGGPLHLIASVASFAVAGYAVLRITELPATESVLVWFVAAILVHDLVFFPLYTLLDWVANGRTLAWLGSSRRKKSTEPSWFPAGSVNYLRVPAVISGLLLIVFSPLILGFTTRYTRSTTLAVQPFLGRWLVLTGIMFAASGIMLALRIRRLKGANHS